MILIIETIIAFLIVFGILVFVHEFGHFFVGKLLKVRIEVFSWGYGKRLFGIKKGDTDYRISALPLGGYVKFAGEEDYEKKVRSPDEFMAKKRWERFLILVMGGLMNILLAIFLITVVNLLGVSIPKCVDQPPVIGWIEENSPAYRANLKINDEILEINGKKTKTWKEVEIAIGTRPGKIVSIKIKRGNKILVVKLKTEAKTRYQMGYAGFLGKIYTEVVMISPGSPADKGGLKIGDIILKINNQPVYFYQFHILIQSNPERELEFLVKRGKELKLLKITPKRENGKGKIGILSRPESKIKKYGLFKAIGQSIKENYKMASLVLDFIKKLIAGEASPRQLGGPIEIAAISYSAMKAGILSLLMWMAIISLQLGIINLLPIPVLDGGHIFVLVIEGIVRRDFSPKVKERLMQIGFAFLILLMAFVILNDIARRLPQGWESLIPWK
jgi:regulator of sigma E protease